MTYEELMDEYTTRKNIIDPMMKSLLTMVNKVKRKKINNPGQYIPQNFLPASRIGEDLVGSAAKFQTN